MPRVPDHFHFVFGLKPQAEPFHIVHYLCLKSCLEVNRPRWVDFHYHHEPFGPWWERIKPHLQLRRVERDAFVLNHPAYRDHQEGRFIKASGLDYAHQADFIRLEVLLEHGGVYADMDTLFIRPVSRHLFDRPFVLGEEDPVEVGAQGPRRASLCNAFIMSEPESRFGQRWLERMYAVFDGTWSRHSCGEAALLAASMAQDIHVVPSELFYPVMWTRAGIHGLFRDRVELPAAASSVHLWSHLWWDAARADFTDFHAGLITEDHIRSVDTTYNLIARRFLD